MENLNGTEARSRSSGRSRRRRRLLRAGHPEHQAVRPLLLRSTRRLPTRATTPPSTGPRATANISTTSPLVRQKHLPRLPPLPPADFHRAARGGEAQRDRQADRRGRPPRRPEAHYGGRTAHPRRAAPAERYHRDDTYVPLPKQLMMMQVILYFYDKASAVIARGSRSPRSPIRG